MSKQRARTKKAAGSPRDDAAMPMKVFISWSGSQSRAIAEAFRDFIGNVIQNVTPFMSSHDIEAGSRWQDRLAKELAESVVGVLCLTPDNLGSEWVQFEAGAL